MDAATTIKSLHDLQALLREHAEMAADRYGIGLVAVFGSYARADATHDSDLDILVEYTRPSSLMELAGAEACLSDALGVRTDLVQRRALRPELRDRILQEAAPL